MTSHLQSLIFLSHAESESRHLSLVTHPSFGSPTLNEIPPNPFSHHLWTSLVPFPPLTGLSWSANAAPLKEAACRKIVRGTGGSVIVITLVTTAVRGTVIRSRFRTVLTLVCRAGSRGFLPVLLFPSTLSQYSAKSPFGGSTFPPN